MFLFQKHVTDGRTDGLKDGWTDEGTDGQARSVIQLLSRICKGIP